MNTLKARAWDGKRMVYFSDVKISILSKGAKETPYVYFATDNFDGYASLGNHEVMLFTGHTDRNKKEIYAGDVRREEIEHDEGDERLYFVCTWIEELARFAWLQTPGEYQQYMQSGLDSFVGASELGMDHEEKDKIVICGNIYENPKLLNDKPKKS